MLEVQCVKVPVAPVGVVELREWIQKLPERRHEVLEALGAEGIADEAVFLSRESDGVFLYLYSRSPDLARAAAEFQASEAAVDVEFKRLMAEHLDFSSAVPLELLFAADRPGEWVVGEAPP